MCAAIHIFKARSLACCLRGKLLPSRRLRCRWQGVNGAFCMYNTTYTGFRVEPITCLSLEFTAMINGDLRPDFPSPVAGSDKRCRGRRCKASRQEGPESFPRFQNVGHTGNRLQKRQTCQSSRTMRPDRFTLPCSAVVAVSPGQEHAITRGAARAPRLRRVPNCATVRGSVERHNAREMARHRCRKRSKGTSFLCGVC